MDESKQVNFKPIEPIEPKLRVSRSFKKKDADKYKKFCQHLNVEVDDFNRTLNCTNCGAYLEAFDYILLWANQERVYQMEADWLRIELGKLRKEKEELLKDVVYLRRKKKAKEIKLNDGL